MTRDQWIRTALIVALLELVLIAFLRAPAHARDTTGFSAQLSPEQQDWVRGLHSKSGLYCCDNADGIDPVWDMDRDHYRVRHEGEWLIVSPDALLTQPNKIGVARAWIGYQDGKPFVRCFLPGPTI